MKLLVVQAALLLSATTLAGQAGGECARTASPPVLSQQAGQVVQMPLPQDSVWWTTPQVQGTSHFADTQVEGCLAARQDAFQRLYTACRRAPWEALRKRSLAGGPNAFGYVKDYDVFSLPCACDQETITSKWNCAVEGSGHCFSPEPDDYTYEFKSLSRSLRSYAAETKKQGCDVAYQDAQERAGDACTIPLLYNPPEFRKGLAKAVSPRGCECFRDPSARADASADEAGLICVAVSEVACTPSGEAPLLVHASR